MMKRNNKMLLCAALALSLGTACSSSEQRPVTESKPADSSPSEETAESSGDPDAEQSNPFEEALAAIAEEEKQTASDELPAQSSSASSSDLASIEETVLMDEEGVRIVAKALTDEPFWGLCVELEIENNSDQDRGIRIRSLVVNDYMVPPLFYSEVAAHKKSMERISLTSDILNKSGISDIGEIAIRFSLYDVETYMTEFVSDEVVLRTNHADQVDFLKADDGVELVSQDGIRVVGKYLAEDPLWGNAVILFLENQTDQDVIVLCEDLSVNGYMMTSFFASEINAGRMAVDKIVLMDSELDDAGIETVEDLELKFRVQNQETYETLFTTDAIPFSIGQ